jgi:hypothetical protein
VDRNVAVVAAAVSERRTNSWSWQQPVEISSPTILSSAAVFFFLALVVVVVVVGGGGRYYNTKGDDTTLRRCQREVYRPLARLSYRTGSTGRKIPSMGGRHRDGDGTRTTTAAVVVVVVLLEAVVPTEKGRNILIQIFMHLLS